jgi:hypothetical protein
MCKSTWVAIAQESHTVATAMAERGGRSASSVGVGAWIVKDSSAPDRRILHAVPIAAVRCGLVPCGQERRNPQAVPHGCGDPPHPRAVRSTATWAATAQGSPATSRHP